MTKRVSLKPIVHDKSTVLWCGPAALAAITGRPTSEVHRVLEVVSGRVSVKGIWHHELKQAALALGYKLTRLELNSVLRSKEDGTMTYPTLANWTKANRELLARHTVVINITGHYVVVSGRSFVDNQTKKVVSLKSAPHRRCQVRDVFLVEETGAPVTVPPAPVKPADPYRFIRLRAQHLARKIGVTLEPHVGPNERWVYPPPALSHDDLDRYAGDHMGYDWGDILKRVEAYAEDLSKVTA